MDLSLIKQNLESIEKRIHKKSIEIKSKCEVILVVVKNNLNIDYQQFQDMLMEPVFQLVKNIFESDQDQGLKLYEHTYMIVVQLISQQGFQLSEKIDIQRYVTLFSNIRCSFIQSNSLLFVKTILYSVLSCFLIESTLDVLFSYKLLKLQILNLFQHLYKQKDENIYYLTDFQSSTYFKKDYMNFHNKIQDQCIISYTVGSDTESLKPIPSNADSQLCNIIFDTFQVIMSFHFNNISAFIEESNIEVAIIESVGVVFQMFQNKPSYGLQLVQLLIKEIEKYIQNQDSKFHRVKMYVYILLLIGKIFMFSLFSKNIEIYKQSLILLKEINLQLIQFSQLRKQYFIIYEAFVLHVVSSYDNAEFKQEAIKFIIKLLFGGSSFKIIDIYLNLFDFNGIEFILQTMTVLLNQLKLPTVQIKYIIPQFKIISIKQLFSAHETSNQPREERKDLSIKSIQDLVLVAFVKFFRYFQDQNLNLTETSQYFQFRECISVFNNSKNPIKDINVFIKYKLIQPQKEDIISFLIEQNQHLNKSNIGIIFGGNKPINQLLLEEYSRQILDMIQILDFLEPQTFLQGLRQFLNYFKIPGESQQIDRILKQFSILYAQKSQSYTQESIYVLSYATLMLNTDIHNKSVKEKMTSDDFIRNTRNADKVKNFDDKYLRKLYLEILKNPITLQEIELNKSIDKKGEMGYYEYQLKIISQDLVQQIFISEKLQCVVFQPCDNEIDQTSQTCNTDEFSVTLQTSKSSVIQTLEEKFQIKQVSLQLLEYLFQNFLLDIISYMQQMKFIEHFQPTKEIIFHLYKLASVSDDCTNHRSFIINQLSSSFLLGFQGYFPQVDYYLELSSVTVKTQSQEQIDQIKITSQFVLTDLILLPYLLITKIDRNIFYQSYDMFLFSQFLAQHINSIYCIGNNKSINTNLYDNPLNKENCKLLMEQNPIFSLFGYDFQKQLTKIQELHPGLSITNLEFIYILDINKSVQSLLLLQQLFLCEASTIEKQLKKQYRIILPFFNISQVVANLFESLTNEERQFLSFQNNVMNQFIESKQFLDILSTKKYYGLTGRNLKIYQVFNNIQQNFIHQIQNYTVYSNNLQKLQNTVEVFLQILQILLKQREIEINQLINDDIIFVLSHILISISSQDISQCIAKFVIQLISKEEVYCSYNSILSFTRTAISKLINQKAKVNILSCNSCYHQQCSLINISPLFQSNFTIKYKTLQDWVQLQQLILFIIDLVTEKVDTIIDIHDYTIQLIKMIKQFQYTNYEIQLGLQLQKVFKLLYQKDITLFIDCTQFYSEEVLMHFLVENECERINFYIQILLTNLFLLFEAEISQEIKQEKINKFYNFSIIPMIIQQRQVKSYTLYQEIIQQCIDFQNSILEESASCHWVLKQLVNFFPTLFIQKYPSILKLQELITITLFNILSFESQDSFAEDILTCSNTIFENLINNQDQLTDGLIALNPIFTTEISLKQDYLNTIFVSFCTIFSDQRLSNKNELVHKFSLQVRRVVNQLINILQEQSMTSSNIDNLIIFYNNVLDMILNTNTSQIDSNFELCKQVSLFILQFQNINNNDNYMELVMKLLNIIQIFLVSFNTQKQKILQIHYTLTQYILFDNRCIRDQLIMVLTSFQEVFASLTIE